MESNRAFGIYVAVLVGALLSVITTTVMAGVTTLPTFLTLVEHVSLSLLFRGAYHSFAGPYHVFETIFEGRAAKAAEQMGAPSTGNMAGAAS